MSAEKVEMALFTMTINRKHGIIGLTCNGCGTTRNVPLTDLQKEWIRIPIDPTKDETAHFKFFSLKTAIHNEMLKHALESRKCTKKGAEDEANKKKG